MKLEGAYSLKEKLWQTWTEFKKQRHHFADKCPYSQSYGFSSSHGRMWELDHKEGWVLKNWCFWTMLLEKTLESPLDNKEIKPVNLKGNQPWIFRTNAEAPIFWPPDMKSKLIGKVSDAGKNWGQEEKEVTEGEMVGWHHWLNGHEFEQLQEIVKDTKAWYAAFHRSQRLSHNLVAEQQCKGATAIEGFRRGNDVELLRLNS